jgi:hypothetical protein
LEQWTEFRRSFEEVGREDIELMFVSFGSEEFEEEGGWLEVHF